VNHSILLTKLEHYDAIGNAFKLIQSCLSERKQYVQEEHQVIFKTNYFWGPPRVDFRPIVLFVIYK